MDQNRKPDYDAGEYIHSGKAVLGFELGSTRIKGTLIGPDFRPLAAGSYGWENKFEQEVWTYDLNEVWAGLAGCFTDLRADIRKTYSVELRTFAGAGFSAMMHGYLVFDKDDNLLVPFSTWRNNIAEAASTELTQLFSYPIPQRWSIAHLDNGPVTFFALLNFCFHPLFFGNDFNDAMGLFYRAIGRVRDSTITKYIYIFAVFLFHLVYDVFSGTVLF